MLQHLYIRDLAIVASTELHFSSGMTVITGETGAGKSLLLDALALALGQRSDSQLIRPHADRAEIAATFDISTLPSAVLWLADLELTGDTPQQCIIRRILYANGRSKAFINGRPVTTQQLRLLGEHLVQIHGQHQHQLLLKSSEQLRLLDAFAQHDTLLSQVKTAYQAWKKCQQRRQQLQQALQQHQSQSELLNYQIEELNHLQLAEQEWAALEQEYDQLAHAQQDRQASEAALLELENMTGISHALHILKPLYERLPLLHNVRECLNTAHIQIQEAIVDLNHFINHVDIHPTRLETIERRLERIYEMARKHKVEPSHLYAHHQALMEKAAHFECFSQNLIQIEEDIQLAAEQYEKWATQLTLARQQAADKLASAVSDRIHTLGMGQAIFTVTCLPYEKNEWHADGKESVLFGISANPGHPPQPLSKVASGGELSRISLALELITCQYLATPSLVFDEVDVGISGKIGAMVGHALRQLGQSAQIFCVTHLPQVAAQGHHHIHVIKKKQKNNTETVIALLDEKGRIEEIARMLGGIDVTAQARAHAKALLCESRLKEPNEEADCEESLLGIAEHSM